VPGLAPFDPAAALAVLLLYAPPSPANLARALTEHPATFMGAGIIGHSGDVIQLPDGRQYDCIVNVGGPLATRRWQCSYIDPNVPGTPPDPFALEQGPLAYVNEDTPIGLPTGPSMEDIVTGQLAELGGTDAALDNVATTVQAFNGADALDGATGAYLDPAKTAHEEIRGAIDADDPRSVIDATNSHDGEIDQARGDYVEDPPPDTAEPDPGDPPDQGPPPDNPPPAA